ncbi:MAG: hypothetical protein Q8M16_11465 [Pirellulaceae bacterium]|nr:hypothetical protein [Pirellulaceae bacterium]
MGDESDEILSDAQKKKVVEALMRIVDGDNPTLALKAVSRVLEMEKRNQQAEREQLQDLRPGRR